MNNQVRTFNMDQFNAVFTSISSQSYQPDPFMSFGSCFSSLDTTLQSLTGLNSQLDQQTEFLLKISNELKSIESNLADIESLSTNFEPERKRKILKLRKTASRTPMHKIFNHDDACDADLGVEVVVCGIQRDTVMERKKSRKDVF